MGEVFRRILWHFCACNRLSTEEGNAEEQEETFRSFPPSKHRQTSFLPPPPPLSPPPSTKAAAAEGGGGGGVLSFLSFLFSPFRLMFRRREEPLLLCRRLFFRLVDSTLPPTPAQLMFRREKIRALAPPPIHVRGV